MAGQRLRSKRIIALLPPPESEDSDLESDDDEERRILAREFFRDDRSSRSSSPRSVSPGLFDLLDVLSDDGDEADQDMTTTHQDHRRQEILAPESPLVQDSPALPTYFSVPETPSMSSVASPLTPGLSTHSPHPFIVPVSPAVMNSAGSFIAGVRTRRTRPGTTTGSSPMPPPPIPNTRKRKMKHLDFSFKKTKYTGTVEVDVYPKFAEQFELKSPRQYLQSFFSDDLINFIVDMTNLYSVQESGKSLCVTKKEIESWLGIEIIMGIVNMPAVEDYWSNDLRFEPIASAMTLKRYRCIKRYVHFCDNTNVDKTDNYHKVSAVIEHVRQRCLQVEEERSFAIDEMIIPYKGKKAGNRKQYNPKKPHKWGFKFLVRAGKTGMVYDFFPYDGADTFRNVRFTEWEEDYLGVGGKTVVRLCKTISNPVLCTVYFDNWFTSLELIYYLRHEMGILSLGTIRKDRLRNCRTTSDKDMKKKGRGTHEVICDNERRLAVTKWVDNQCINIASSFCAQHPVTTIERYDKKEKKKVAVSCPNAIKVYNAHMGGVDIADMLTALYRIHMKTRRWYLSIFSQTLDISLNNSWLLHRRDCQQLGESNLSLKKFRIQAALSLITTDRKSRIERAPLAADVATISKPIKPRPVNDARLDCYDHFPVFTSQGRCRLCTTGKTKVMCGKCEIRLCFTPKKNCFLCYHKEK